MRRRSNKRFTSEKQVVQAIDKLRGDAVRWLAEAEAKESVFKYLINEAAAIEAKEPGKAAVLRNNASMERKEMVKLRKKAERAIEVTAKKLGEKLSILRTDMLFPGVPKDIPQRLA